MDGPPEPSRLDTITERRDFLAALRDEPRGKSTMVEDLDHSRSTVDRAIRTLEDQGLVERTTDGYRTTMTGRLAVERYEQFLAETNAVIDARDDLNALPTGLAVPASLCLDGEPIRDAYRQFEVLAEALSGAARCRVLWPRLADTRHLRLVHSHVVEGSLDATIFAGPDVHDRIGEEFPLLTVDLVESGSFRAVATSVPDVGLVVATDGDGDRTLLVLVYEGDQIDSVVRTTAPETVAWAQKKIDAVSADGDDVTDELRAQSERTPAPRLDGDRLSDRLRTQGFERIDEQYFRNRRSVDPVVAWRAGLTLPEVAAGYAVERTKDDDESRKSVVEELVSDLDSGTNIALLGSPGSGKSTVCKQVAYRWFDSQRGPVFYRESGRRQPFESTDALESTLEGVDGHALIVVEDAVTPGANAIFDVLGRFSDREDVTCLLDARETEWRDPDDLPLAEEVEAFRHEQVETVRMPQLDHHERERILDRFEAILDTDLSGAREQLLAEETADTAGDVFLFFHRLTRYADPLGTDERTTVTSLDQHVERVRSELAAAGEGALDVGVFANALNAAEIEIRPVYLHALATTPDIDTRTVESAVEVLEGEVLFRHTEAAAFETVHGAWSVAFLAHLLEADEEATDRFGNAVTALLALADETSRRQAITDAVEPSDDGLEVIATAPTKWADETARQLFDLGYAKLAELFGTEAAPSFELPSACGDETYQYGCFKRGQMYFEAGEPERARQEYETVIDELADPTSDPNVSTTTGGLYAKALYGLSQVAEVTGGDVIEDRHEALEAFEAVGDERGICLMHIELGRHLPTVGKLEAGRKHVEQALEVAEAIGDTELQSWCHTSLGELHSHVEEQTQSYAEMEQALTLAREVGSSQAEVTALRGLAVTSRRVGDLSMAVEYGRQWLDVAETIGDTHNQLTAHTMLSAIAIDRGHLADAADHLERASDLATGTRLLERANLQTNRGRLAWIRGDYKEACERLDAAIERCRKHELWQLCSTAHVYKALAELGRGERARAIEAADTALEIEGEQDAQRNVGRIHDVYGRIALDEGDLDRAASEFETALVRGDGPGTPNGGLARRGLGHVARERDDDETARQHYEQALETFRENDRARLALDTVDDLAELGGPERWYTVGAEIAEAADLDHRAADYLERAEEVAEQRPTTE